MQSRNPVFNRTEGFNGRSAGYPGVTTQQPGYADFGGTGPGYAPPTARMTIDSVIQRLIDILISIPTATFAICP